MDSAVAGVRLPRARLSIRLPEPLHRYCGGHDQTVSVHSQWTRPPPHGDRGHTRWETHTSSVLHPSSSEWRMLLSASRGLKKHTENLLCWSKAFSTPSFFWQFFHLLLLSKVAYLPPKDLESYSCIYYLLSTILQLSLHWGWSVVTSECSQLVSWQKKKQPELIPPVLASLHWLAVHFRIH